LPHRCPAFSIRAGRHPVRRLAAVLAIAALAAVQGGIAVGQSVVEPNRTGAGTGAPSPAGSDLAYTTILPETGEEELDRALAAASNLADLQDEPPPSAFGLIRRAEADRARLLEVAHALGWWGAVVEVRLAGLRLDAIELPERIERATEPVEAVVSIEPGPLYTIGMVALVDAEDGTEGLPVDVDLAALDLDAGDPARAEAVVRAQRRLIDQMRSAGHPFAEIPARQVYVDHAQRTMEITFALEPGPQAGLGPVDYDGLERTDADFLRRRVPFEPGARYSPERIDELRRDLASLGVFSSVRVVPDDSLNEEGLLPLTVQVEERPPRFVGFFLRYETDEGFGGRATWGHRNLFGAAERLRLGVEIGGIAGSDYEDYDFRATASFTKPDVLAVDQDLTANLELVDETTDAFERTALLADVGLERKLSDTLTVGGGLAFEQSEITEPESTDTFTLIGLPLFVRIDRSDNLLNPTEGWRLTVTGTPFYNLGDRADWFARLRADVTGYVDFGTEGRTVLAGRIGTGTLFGADAQDVPADRRFYAGGGGSVRGYAFQAVGPEDAFGDPAGGASLLEGSVELRQRFGESFGVVGFVDAGTVTDDLVPATDDLRLGAGIGIRYFTGFGPVRADIGVPLNPDGDDDAFQFYASFGQAF